jgi:hypothetical protein
MMQLDTDLEDGRPVTVEYEFDEGDPNVGVDDDFEIIVYFEGKDITDEITSTDEQAIRAQVAEDFAEYIQDCRNDAAADRAEQQAFDCQWNDHYGD